MVVVPPDVVYAIHNRDDVAALARWLDASPDDGHPLSHPRTPDDMDDEVGHPYTLLMIAAEYGSYNCAKFLLERGAQINLGVSGHADMPLHVASLSHHYDDAGLKFIDLLLDAGADVHVRGARISDSSMNHHSDQTPVGKFLDLCSLRASSNAPAFLGRFLRAGADVDAVAGIPGNRLSAEDVLARRSAVDESSRLPRELLEMLAGYRAAGCSWKAYKRGPHMAVLALRSLRARGRAVATPGTSSYVERVTSPDFPSGVVWKILEYWCAAE